MTDVGRGLGIPLAGDNYDRLWAMRFGRNMSNLITKHIGKVTEPDSHKSYGD